MNESPYELSVCLCLLSVSPDMPRDVRYELVEDIAKTHRTGPYHNTDHARVVEYHLASLSSKDDGFLASYADSASAALAALVHDMLPTPRESADWILRRLADYTVPVKLELIEAMIMATDHESAVCPDAMDPDAAMFCVAEADKFVLSEKNWIGYDTYRAYIYTEYAEVPDFVQRRREWLHSMLAKERIMSNRKRDKQARKNLTKELRLLEKYVIT